MVRWTLVSKLLNYEVSHFCDLLQKEVWQTQGQMPGRDGQTDNALPTWKTLHQALSHNHRVYGEASPLLSDCRVSLRLGRAVASWPSAPQGEQASYLSSGSAVPIESELNKESQVLFSLLSQLLLGSKPQEVLRTSLSYI